MPSKGAKLPDILTLARSGDAGELGAKGQGTTLCARSVVFGEERKALTVGIAACDGQRNLATSLINRMYAWRGYGADHQLSSGRNCVTFTACLGENVIGTLTLAVDTPAGLASDTTFKHEIDELRRQPNTTLCELSKFAFDPEVKSHAALATLFHTIFLYEARCYGSTDLIIEVNPRHVRFYEMMLGFERIGEPNIYASVPWWPTDVPVQLMRLNLAAMKRHIERGTMGSSTRARSLYPHFLSEQEERVVVSRIPHSPGAHRAIS